MADSSLPVVTAVYDLILWFSRHAVGFPRQHRYTMACRIDNLLNGLLEHLIDARFDPRERIRHLQACNRLLEHLRFQFRLARDLQCLATKSYGHAATQIEVIGRMVGGWLKAVENRS
jgi:hypothetical protein